MEMEGSERGKNIPFSAMRKFSPLAASIKKQGVQIHHLNIGQPDLPTPETFWNAVTNFPKKEKTLAYAPSPGRPELLEAMEYYYTKVVGLKDVTKDNILITVGGCEALLVVMMAVADVGDEVLIPEPFYSNYRGCAAMSGVTIRTVSTLCEDDYRLPPRPDIEKCITPKTRAIIFASPGNPTGTVYTRDEIFMLADICRDHGLFLVGDEVYREFSYSGTAPTSVLEVPNFQQNAIMIDSASKRLSACGARIGSIVSGNPNIMQSCLRLITVRLSAPALDQVGVAACLVSPTLPDYTRQCIEEYKKRRDVVVAGIKRIQGATCPVPGGAFYLVAKLEGIQTDHFVQWLLESFRSSDNETVLIAPMAGFYATPGLGEDEVRIAYVLECSILERAMALLKAAVAQYRQLHAGSSRL